MISPVHNMESRRSATAASGFQADLGTFAWWLRGDDMTLNGYDVSSWNDKSGNGRHWTQSTAAAAPQISTSTLNGHDGVLLTAANSEYLNGPNLAAVGLTECEAYFVLKAGADPSGQLGAGGLLGVFGSSGVDYADFYPYQNGYHYSAFGSNNQRASGLPAPPAITVPRIYSLVTTASAFSAYMDGVFLTSYTPNTVAWGSAPRIGRGGSGDSLYFSGTIWEFGAYTAKLSDANRALLVSGLKEYYGGWA